MKNKIKEFRCNSMIVEASHDVLMVLLLHQTGATRRLRRWKSSPLNDRPRFVPWDRTSRTSRPVPGPVWSSTGPDRTGPTGSVSLTRHVMSPRCHGNRPGPWVPVVFPGSTLQKSQFHRCAHTSEHTLGASSEQWRNPCSNHGARGPVRGSVVCSCTTVLSVIMCVHEF